MNVATALDAEKQFIGCEYCGTVSIAPEANAAATLQLRCPRCNSRLHARKPRSVQRTWAYLIASMVLYVPANLLPIMTTTNVFRNNTYTIAGGIGELWTDKAFGLAAIVFIASIVVPLLKIVSLGLLLWTARHAPRWRQLDRARLYRIVEMVGHWSMLDVYVVVLLAGMVRFGRLASIHPEPGLLAFASVVILTMLATRSFDPRLIWQEPQRRG
jgi:paraquat-inducible protein A